MILVDPVQGVLNEELAHLFGTFAIEVDGGSPWTVMPRREVKRAELRRVRAIGTEVIVDDVENHREAAPMRRIHKPAQIVRCAIRPRRGIEAHAVVPPIAGAGKVGDRHQLEDCDAEIGQVRQAFGHAREGAGFAERPYVQLVHNRQLKRNTPPPVIRPCECPGIHDGRRAVDPLRLKSGRGIW